MKATGPGCGPADPTFLHCGIRHQGQFEITLGKKSGAFLQLQRAISKETNVFFSH